MGPAEIQVVEPGVEMQPCVWISAEVFSILVNYKIYTDAHKLCTLRQLRSDDTIVLPCNAAVTMVHIASFLDACSRACGWSGRCTERTPSIIYVFT